MDKALLIQRYTILKAFVTVLIIAGSSFAAADDPAANQLPNWASMYNLERCRSRSDLGSVFPSETASLTTNPVNGPILLQDVNFIDKVATFNRERIPERVVHAKGAGAHGEFRVTHDITRYTKAAVFGKVGRRTSLFVRFSTVGGESGSADTVRDPRGFAIKFHTSDGNWDFLGISLPVFFIRDPILFPAFQHAGKRNPQTHFSDPTSHWDFLSLRPETINHIIRVMSDLGTPRGFRHMNGFGVNAFRFVNSAGEVHYTKFHFLTQQGIRNMTLAQAKRMTIEDPDYAIRDLYNAIATKNYPRWTLNVQIMTEQQATQLPTAFDPTKLWDETKFPLLPVGELVLNRNPSNFFAQVEQAAFDPGNLVPGIEMSPDRLMHGRSFAYADAQRYRLGQNFVQLPINRPKNVRLKNICNYNRDGVFWLKDTAAPSYFPNSFGGPTVSTKPHDQVGPPMLVRGTAERTDSGGTASSLDDFSQATEFYQGLTSIEKGRLVDNIVSTLKMTIKSVQDRVLANVFAKVSTELESRIQNALS